MIEINLPKELQKWFQDLPNWQPPVFLVGGTIRDILLTAAPKDFDLIHPEADQLATALHRIATH